VATVTEERQGQISIDIGIACAMQLEPSPAVDQLFIIDNSMKP